MFRKTVVTIRQWIDHSVFHHVAKEAKADELWKKLEILYERKTAQNKTSLIKRLVNPKFKDGHSVSEHLSDFQGLVRMCAMVKLRAPTPTWKLNPRVVLDRMVC